MVHGQVHGGHHFTFRKTGCKNIMGQLSSIVCVKAAVNASVQPHNLETMICPMPIHPIMQCLRIAAQNFANIELPMGGKITSVDADHIELVIPRIQVFDVWLQPRAFAALRWGPWVTRGLITQVGTWGDPGTPGDLSLSRHSRGVLGHWSS